MELMLNTTCVASTSKNMAKPNAKTAPKYSAGVKKKAHATPRYFEFNNPEAQQTRPKPVVARKLQRSGDRTTKNVAGALKIYGTGAPTATSEVSKKQDDNGLLLNICTAPDAKPADAELMLNIYTKPVPPKPTKYERQEKKRNDHKNPFSKEEIGQAIKRSRENPNKQPRAGDVFRKEQEQERRQRNAEHATDVKEEANKESYAPRRGKKVEDLLHGIDSQSKMLGQRYVKPITERLFDGTKVETLGLHAHTVKNLADLLSITELTTVQRKAVPEALAGHDLLVRSQTGSGKTLVYALPVIEQLQAIRPKVQRADGIYALIIVPSHELAGQTYELLQKLVKPFTWLVPGVLMGGECRKREKARLRKGINVLVGTPGRLLDHILHTECLKLEKLRFLVLDEADRLLDMGYERDVKQIIEAATSKQNAEARIQRLLLSATLSSAVENLAGLTLHEPIFIDNSDEHQPGLAKQNANGYTKDAIEAAVTTNVSQADSYLGVLTIPENLKLDYVLVPIKLRLVCLAAMLYKSFNGQKKFKAIVFMSTMEMVNFHHDLLNEALTKRVLDNEDEDEEEESDDEGPAPLLLGLRFFKLHGSLTQTERQGVFNGFRACNRGVLLATDVVGRGVDVPEVDLVVQYSPPQKTADFVHRVGRTARAGRRGHSILFLVPDEVKFLGVLEQQRIRIGQTKLEDYLKALAEADPSARDCDEAARNLQKKFEDILADDKELHTRACKAYVSWMKYYSAFPRELKPMFNIKNVHVGHFAKSFGLNEEPKWLASKFTVIKKQPATNRLTYTEREPERPATQQDQQRNKRRVFTTTVTGEVRDRQTHNAGNFSAMQKSRMLNMSEYDSGLPPAKKRKQ